MATTGQANDLPDYNPPSWSPSYSDVGGVGLFQTPTARSMPDGRLNFGYSTIFPYDRIFLTVQGLPWLEATFRITEITNRIERGSIQFGDTQSFYDRGIDLKARLHKESKYLPEIALGLRDIGGTGQFSSEYLVASRRYYNWDFTGGIAWGNLGTRGHLSNPLKVFSDKLGSRSDTDDTISNPGSFKNNFFRGKNIGLFGGIEYQMPNYGLRFKLEYDGNDYQSEPLSNRFDVDSPINFGLEYHPYEWLHLSTSWQRGNEAMFRVSLNQSLKETAAVPKILDKEPVTVLPRSDIALIPLPTQNLSQLCRFNERIDINLARIESKTAIFHLNNNCQPDKLAFNREVALQLAGVEGIESYEYYWQGLVSAGVFDTPQTDPQELYKILADRYIKTQNATEKAILQTEENLAAALSKKGFKVNAIDFDQHTATIWLSQTTYRRIPQAVGRAGRIVANHLPKNIGNIEFIFLEKGVTVNKITITKDSVEQLETTPQLAWHSGDIEPTDQPYKTASYINQDRYPAFDWSVSPAYRQNFGGPDAYYVYQIYLALSASWQPLQGLIFSGSYGQNIFNTFDELQLESDSKLPKVRSNLKNYLQQGDSGINSLQATYLFDIAPDWYGRASAGIYELMFGGVGGEILYAPFGKRWAIGAEFYQVQQRDFDAGFGFQDYEIGTGHVSLYYDLPFYNMSTELNVGRYLAGDDGATLTVSREFDSGVELGVFATITDVPAERFGEGSFDKGFYINFPLDMFFIKSSRSKRSVVFRPVTRDGGAKVGQSNKLYPLIESHRKSQIDRDWKFVQD